MKIGNISRVVINKLPFFYKNSENRKVNAFDVFKGHRYFKFSSFRKSEGDINLNRNKRNYLYWKNNQTFNLQTPTSTARSQLTNFSGSTIQNSSIKKINVSFNFTPLCFRNSKCTKSFLTKKNSTDNIYFHQDDAFEKTLRDKILSLSQVSERVKKQATNRNLCFSTQKGYERLLGLDQPFRSALSQYRSMKKKGLSRSAGDIFLKS